MFTFFYSLLYVHWVRNIVMKNWLRKKNVINLFVSYCWNVHNDESVLFNIKYCFLLVFLRVVVIYIIYYTTVLEKIIISHFLCKCCLLNGRVMFICEHHIFYMVLIQSLSFLNETECPFKTCCFPNTLRNSYSFFDTLKKVPSEM